MFSVKGRDLSLAYHSVDLETDLKIQGTILREFKHKTLLCIAHRLRTIINYDKVLVMDQGEVAVRAADFISSYTISLRRRSSSVGVRHAIESL
jgi:energy-coupling factor transporter ATP-binding protein EcfA2